VVSSVNGSASSSVAGRRDGGGRGAALALWLTAVASIAGCQPNDYPIGRILASQRLAAPPPGAIEYLDRMAKTTRYSGRLAVNSLPARAGGLAVFFLRRDLDWERLRRQEADLMALRDNCCALRDEATISCDSAFLETFLPSHVDYANLETTRTAFVRWVLGHELGHVVLGQGGLHFAPAAERRQGLRNLAIQRQEYAADCWMIRRFLALYGKRDEADLEGLAMGFINFRLRETSGPPPAGVGILYDYSRLDPYDFRGDASHPDLLLRSARLLHVAASVDTTTGLSVALRGFTARLVPDPLWKDRGPCS
jgi:hypothetical protein